MKNGGWLVTIEDEEHKNLNYTQMLAKVALARETGQEYAIDFEVDSDVQ